MDLTKAMQTFVDVVDAGSFAAAAAKQDASSALVSRQISALEAHLGARLMQRTTRRLSLTEPGQALYERAKTILADIAETEAIVGQHALKPAGHLRVSAPVSFGVRKLAPVLPAFCRRYPDIALEIDFSDRVVDLVNDGIDVAVRIAKSPSPNLIARRIAPVDMLVCAAPDYLRRRGTPKMPQDLADHDTLGYAYLASGDSWVFSDDTGATVPVRIRPRAHANNGDVLGELARAGLGIVVQPDFLAADDIAAGALKPLLPGWSIGAFHLYAVYLSRKFLSPKVRVFVDHLAAALGRRHGTAAKRT